MLPPSIVRVGLPSTEVPAVGVGVAGFGVGRREFEFRKLPTRRAFDE
jgi:hypothetical protein